jgi:ABC-2 type transport system ATP-binding protein
MNALVELKDLTKYYNSGRPAIDNMSLSLSRGKIVGLLGPNGSGKTTLIKMLNGLLVPTKGSIRIGGCTPGVETKKHVAYLPDRDYLDNSQKVSDFLAYYGDFYDDFDQAKALEMLKNLQIEPGQRLRTLSKGTKEKVQLILVMSRKADLYILDEPIAGVDPAARDYILRTIINNYNPGATVLLATHLIGDIEQVLDEVVFLQTGKLVLYNSVDAIREQHGKSVDAYFREVFAC